MYGLILFFVFLTISAAPPVFADQGEQVITLKDGSQIKGQLSGIVDGVYTIKTPIIGNVTVNASDVASITNGATPAATAPAASVPSQAAVQNVAPSGSTSNLDQQVAANQQKLMSNPQSMAILREMMQDPEIMQALQDPALVQAVTSHDYQAVQNNPGVQKLLNNPKMQALLQQLVSQQQNTSS